jgi:hypothetical protein
VIENKVMVSGIVSKGIIKSNISYHLGPYNDGSFKTVDIINIHCKKIPVKSVIKGQYCSIWIKSKEKEKIKREDLRKGMVLLDMQINPISTRFFEADIWTIDGTRKLLKSKYQPILFIKHIRQGCRIVEFRNKRKYSNGIINNNNEQNTYNNKSKDNNNYFKKDLKNLNKNINININTFNPLNNLPKIENLNFEKSLIKREREKEKDHNENLNVNVNINENKDKDKDKETPENLLNLLSKNIFQNNFNEKITNNNNNINKENENTQKFLESTNKIEKKKRKSTLNSNNKDKDKDYESEEYKNKNKKRKKSNISQKEESDIDIKSSNYNSDSRLDIEYDQLRSNETLLLQKDKDKDKDKEKEPEETYVISPNNNCTVVFEFMYYPEYITEDANILISDQLIKAHGKVKTLLG